MKTKEIGDKIVDICLKEYYIYFDPSKDDPQNKSYRDGMRRALTKFEQIRSKQCQ